MTPWVQLNGQQQEVWRWQSDAFGHGQDNTNPDGDGRSLNYALRFSGQYHDRESGHYYNYFRDYAPAKGQYIQSDPIGLVVDDLPAPMKVASSLSLIRMSDQATILNEIYAYSKNNPLRYTDHNGLFPAPWCSTWDVILGTCPDIPEDIPYDEAINKWWEEKKNEYCSKPCEAVESACKRALGPGCYMAGTPCLAPCELLKQECLEKKDDACDCEK